MNDQLYSEYFCIFYTSELSLNFAYIVHGLCPKPACKALPYCSDVRLINIKTVPGTKYMLFVHLFVQAHNSTVLVFA